MVMGESTWSCFICFLSNIDAFFFRFALVFSLNKTCVLFPNMGMLFYFSFMKASFMLQRLLSNLDFGGSV